MTDLKPAHAWHTIGGLSDYQSSYELEYRQEATRAHAAEEARDSAMQLVRELLAEKVGQACWDQGVRDEPTGSDMDSICEGLYADWEHGVAVDRLDATPAVLAWMESRR